jgi:DNA repair exonuclease SbcCD ATPase subunit
MQPLSLILKGFRGIRDGLGRDVLKLDFKRLADGAELVAIAGANGRGKTTVMDNMHPYLTMPSRAAMAGPGGFSYYDHVCLPENEKDLIWAHDGRSYRSQVVIRVNGRRKTEAFLLMLADDGAWKPVVLDDGTVSDGKVDTYTRCVEALCGSADTFFTSVFSAQGKRQLSKSGRWASRRARRRACSRPAWRPSGRNRLDWMRKRSVSRVNGAGSTAPRPASRSALRVAKRPRQRRSRSEPGTRN